MAAKKAAARKSSTKVGRNADFHAAFERLKNMFARHEDSLNAIMNKPGNYVVESKSILFRGKPLWVGAVQIKKNYVSFHLIPVYAFPDLMKNVSPVLKKRMQGKSCFNFRKVDEPLFTELEKLTEAGVAKMKDEEFMRRFVEKYS